MRSAVGSNPSFYASPIQVVSPNIILATGFGRSPQQGQPVAVRRKTRGLDIGARFSNGSEHLAITVEPGQTAAVQGTWVISQNAVLRKRETRIADGLVVVYVVGEAHRFTA